MSDCREDIIFEKLQGESDGWETRYSMEEVKFAMDEYMKETCLQLLEYVAKNISRIDRNGDFIGYRGDVFTKEQLFENFL